MLSASTYSIVCDGLYVGNKGSLIDMDFLSNADISAIINLTRKQSPIIENVDIFDYTLPSQELIDTELVKTIAKLDIIKEKIAELRGKNRSVLVTCTTGRDVSVLAAGYYYVSMNRQNYGKIIENLEMLYFSAEQKEQEYADRQLMNIGVEELDQYRHSLTEAEKREEDENRKKRRAIQCLQKASHKKILRLCGGSKK
jgi:hypothetical protein